ncbi:MAG: hypothetical protein R3327_03145 [Nitrosopumilaceae archaeon]|nr:hypothetical protein [Nitrosopumilaceae archaeon]
MSGLNTKPSDKKSLFIISGIIAVIAVSLFVYLMWYVTPEENLERVKIIAVTESGCIGETMDGFAVNIGNCQAEPGDVVTAPVDKKAKERAAAMNPTT